MIVFTDTYLSPSSILGYGQTGPYASRPGYDVMIEAEAGLMYITGEEHGPPVKVGVAVTGKPSCDVCPRKPKIPPFPPPPFCPSVAKC